MSSINCDVAALWSVTMEKLKTVSMSTYSLWFSKATPLCISEDNVLQIGVADDFFRDWIRDAHSDILSDCLKECGYDLAFEFQSGYPVQAEISADNAKETVAEDPFTLKCY